jgi:hypothetical protein
MNPKMAAGHTPSNPPARRNGNAENTITTGTVDSLGTVASGRADFIGSSIPINDAVRMVAKTNSRKVTQKCWDREDERF